MRTKLVAASYLLVVVAACSKPAATEWITAATESGGDGFVTYADPTTIRKTGATVKMWSMTDSAVIQGATGDRPHFSWKNEWEYDCQGKRYRPLQFLEYSGKMGSGENVYRQVVSASEWMAVTPGSVGETLWKIACGKQ